MSGPNTLAIEWALERFRKYPEIDAKVLFRQHEDYFKWQSWRWFDETMLEDAVIRNFSTMPMWSWEVHEDPPLPAYVPQFPIAFVSGWAGIFRECGKMGFLPIALTHQEKSRNYWFQQNPMGFC